MQRKHNFIISYIGLYSECILFVIICYPILTSICICMYECNVIDAGITQIHYYYYYYYYKRDKLTQCVFVNTIMYTMTWLNYSIVSQGTLEDNSR